MASNLHLHSLPISSRKNANLLKANILHFCDSLSQLICSIPFSSCIFDQRGNSVDPEQLASKSNNMDLQRLKKINQLEVFFRSDYL